jgi:hypothetical protein
VLARSIALAACLMGPATGLAQTGAAPLVLEAKIPLGEVSGRIDHLGIDVKRQRLFAAETVILPIFLFAHRTDTFSL